MRRPSLLLALAALALIASACGGDNLDLCDGCGTRTATPTVTPTPTVSSTPLGTATPSAALGLGAIAPTPGG
jgi:hypothetical protein